MKKFCTLLCLLLCPLLASCSKQAAATPETIPSEITYVLDDGSKGTAVQDENGNLVSERVESPEGSVYEHEYDAQGNHIRESCTMTDGSYHEFQYDAQGNVINEIHK